MESLHAFLARIGTRNRTGAPASGTASCCASVVAQTAVSAVSRVANPLAVRRSNAPPISNRRYGRLATCATEQRFMGSLHAFFVAHWDQEPEIRKLFGIKPSVFRFMESLHVIFGAHWDHEPLTAWSPG